jgi:hypothetical protein
VDGTEDRADFLAYGKYHFIPPGRYEMVFRVASHGETSGDPVARLDVVQDLGKRTIAEKELVPADFEGKRGFVDQVITVDLADTVFDLEPRIWVYPRTHFSVDYIYLKPFSAADSPTTLHVEELFYSPYLVRLGDEFRADPEKNIWELFQGPHVRYSAGRYRWTIRARMEPPVRTRGEDPAIGIMHVYTGIEHATLNNREVRASDLAGGEEVDLSMEFETPMDQVLGFKLFFFGPARLYVGNKMRIEPIGPATP